MKNQNRVYKEFTEGKVSKEDVKVIIDKSQHQQNEFASVKLRKVKVEKIRNDVIIEEEDTGPKSMEALKNIFGGMKEKPKYEIKKTVVEDGNISSLKAARLKKEEEDRLKEEAKKLKKQQKAEEKQKAAEEAMYEDSSEEDDDDDEDGEEAEAQSMEANAAQDALLAGQVES